MPLLRRNSKADCQLKLSVSHESAGDSVRVQLTVTNIVLSMAKACAVKLFGDQLDDVEIII